MRFLLQWSKTTPQNWEEFDSSQWGRVLSNKKRKPTGNEILTNQTGWITEINCQGITFVGYDHYSMEDLPGGGCRLYAWNDDPEDLVTEFIGEFYARVLEFYPLAPDPKKGGAWTPNQIHTVYVNNNLRNFYTKFKHENIIVRPWEEFVIPDEADAIHGVWMPDKLMEEHQNKVSLHGWKEWTDGVPNSLIENDKLKSQRSLGLYDKPHGTKTFGLRDTDLANGIHTAANENTMTRGVFGAGETENSSNINGGASELCHVWVSGSTEPNSDDWPSGNYRCSMDVSAAGVDLSFGLTTAGTETGHFSRVNSAISSDLETWSQTEGLFSGVGIHVATTGTIDPSAGNSSNRFECLLAITRAANHGSQSITITYDTDSFADGPWDAGVMNQVRSIIWI